MPALQREEKLKARLVGRRATRATRGRLVGGTKATGQAGFTGGRTLSLTLLHLHNLHMQQPKEGKPHWAGERGRPAVADRAMARLALKAGGLSR